MYAERNWRSLIENSRSFEEADKLIMEETLWRTSREKLAFLSGIFSFSLVACNDDESTDEEKSNFDYIAVLNTIVKAKWR
ncbi:MAG: hypothetical protein FWG91_13030 [Lachnospiraceae bacterium]|nr:hypothetical protein [Lachnospiraceae bacterium]